MRLFKGNYLDPSSVDAIVYFSASFSADKNYKLEVDYSELVKFFNFSKDFYGFYTSFYLNFNNILKLTEVSVFADIMYGNLNFEKDIANTDFLYIDVYLSANDKTLKEFIDFAKLIDTKEKSLTETLLEELGRSLFSLSFPENISPYQLFLIKSFMNSLSLKEVK